MFITQSPIEAIASTPSCGCGMLVIVTMLGWPATLQCLMPQGALAIGDVALQTSLVHRLCCMHSDV
jgi:hypothetical protein